jgi:phosphoglycolate phosphatase
MKIKLIVFDFDGTLIDTREDLAAAMNYALKKCGLTPVDTETVWKYTGDGTPPLIERVLKDKGHPELFEKVKTLFLEYYEKHFADFAKPIPNAKETLENLYKEGKKMAVLSNKYVRFVKKLLKEFGMEKFFFAIYGKDSFEKSKPDPDPLFKIMEIADSTKDETAFVGDSKNDVLISKNAGVRCFIIPSGVNPEEELKSLYECKILDNISELEKYVK